jgi:hypothetical protein
MNPNDTPRADETPEAPEPLVRDLRALYGQAAGVPREVDEAILRMARRQLVRRPRVLVLRWAAAAAMAACVLLAVLLTVPGRRGPVAAPAERLALAREDLDGDGRVDILDAFSLARAIESGNVRRGDWDFNGDGLVDRRDVDAVARAAVKLNGEPER